MPAVAGCNTDTSTTALPNSRKDITYSARNIAMAEFHDPITNAMQDGPDILWWAGSSADPILPESRPDPAALTMPPVRSVQVERSS